MSIARAALIIAAGNVASRVLGIVREQVIAFLFGASAETDAFRVATRIPITLYDLLIGGMISAALVPVLSGYADRDDHDDFWLVSSLIANVMAVLLLILTGVLILLAPQVIALYGPGLDATSGVLATDMLRLTLPAVIFQGLSGVFTAVHYARRHFVAPAASIGVFNLGIIVAALLLHQQLGAISLVIGVLVGAFVQSVVLLFALRGFQYRARLSMSHPAQRKILRLYFPVLIGLGFSSFAVAVDTNLATQTGVGNVSSMIFATTLIQFPLGLIAAAVSYAILPTLSRYALPAEADTPDVVVEMEPDPAAPAEDRAVGDEEKFRKTLGVGLKIVLLAIVPATIGLIILRYPIIQILFQRGAFDIGATETTAMAFLAYAPGLPAAAIDQVLLFAFYSRRNTITPVLVGVMSIGVFLAFAFSLIGPLGFVGLALANSFQWIFHAIVLGFLMWRELGRWKDFGIGVPSLKVLVAGAVMTVPLLIMASLAGLGGVSDGGVFRLLLLTGLVSLVSASIYIGTLALLRLEEVAMAYRLTARWLARR